MMTTILLLGDLVVLTVYALYSNVTYLPDIQGREIHAHFYVVEGLLLAAWLVTATALKTTQVGPRRTLLRVGLGWSLVYVAIYALEFGVKTLLMAPVGRPVFSLFGFGFGWASGLALLLAWRLVGMLWLKALAAPSPAWLRRAARIATAGAVLVVLAALAVEAVTLLAARGRVHSVESAPPASTALVFGAGVWPDGEPSNVLKDRVATACDLYKAGKVSQIIFSGGWEPGEVDETAVMRDLAIEVHGIPADVLAQDPSGARTYASCWAAKQTFGVERAILVTNRYHAARALWTCRQVGIDSQVVVADRHTYPVRSEILWNLREIPATVVAWTEEIGD